MNILIYIILARVGGSGIAGVLVVDFLSSVQHIFHQFSTDQSLIDN